MAKDIKTKEVIKDIKTADKKKNIENYVLILFMTSFV